MMTSSDELVRPFAPRNEALHPRGGAPGFDWCACTAFLGEDLGWPRRPDELQAARASSVSEDRTHTHGTVVTESVTTDAQPSRLKARACCGPPGHPRRKGKPAPDDVITSSHTASRESQV